MDVAQKVCKIISDVTGIDLEKITPQTTFYLDLNMDQLDMTELVMEVEDELLTSIVPDDKIEDLLGKTVADLVRLVEGMMQQDREM